MKRVFIILFVVISFLSIFSFDAHAAVTVTPATGGSAISADNTGGSYTALTGPVIAEGAVNEFPSSGTLVLTAPSGFVFNTAQTVTATITRDVGSKNCFSFTSTTATPTTTTITFTSNAADGNGGNPTTQCRVTFSGIQVRPSSGTPLSSGNLTHSGTASITGLTGSTNLGTLTQVAGAKTQLAITTQPSSTANPNTDFTTKPVVAVRDQFGNTLTADNSSTISRSVVLSTQSCGGTAGSGTLTSTPSTGATVGSGVLTYTAMQYSVAESIKLCFTSSGVTSALSNTIAVTASLPTVTTQAVSSVTATTATGNGTITSTGGENADARGFVYDTTSRSLPGNVSPGSSGYASFAEDTGSFGLGSFTKGLTSLTPGATYYMRAYAHNSQGYTYGNEVSFTTVLISITITSDGSISYGTMAVNTSSNTTSGGLNDTQTVQNDGNISEDFNIRGQNSLNWTLGSSPSSEQYSHEFSTNSGGVWSPLTINYQSLATNIATSGTFSFDLRLTTPSSTASYSQQSVDVTIQAVQH